MFTHSFSLCQAIFLPFASHPYNVSYPFVVAHLLLCVGTAALGTVAPRLLSLSQSPSRRVLVRGVAWRVAVASMAGRKRSTAATQRQMGGGKGNNGSVA
ncbi:hypothetical protein DEO72_LG9g1794 [Vigna unguiculata]|uniref:Uncharacterized protein n=1 Tax=Vigna unguiculata TaxID=3917 RepID=A0A4D6MZ04_VIGUN|nr:hypothetical protein DEO72_LG9g1794 [Vigna unguiculata]